MFVRQYESFGDCAIVQETNTVGALSGSRLLGANQHSTFPFLVVHIFVPPTFVPALGGDAQKKKYKKETCGADSHKLTSKDFESARGCFPQARSLWK